MSRGVAASHPGPQKSSPYFFSNPNVPTVVTNFPAKSRCRTGSTQQSSGSRR